VWIDEAEIQIGDSLIRKIEEGISSTDYLGVVLSPASVASPWVQQEVEVALSKQIGGKAVVVLPFLYQNCDIPPFLSGKLYADFRTDDGYDEELNKVKKRLGLRLTDISQGETPEVAEAEIRSVQRLMHNIDSSLAAIGRSADLLIRRRDQLDPRKQRELLQDIAFFSENARFQERQYRVLRAFQDGTYGLHLEQVHDLTRLLRKATQAFLPLTRNHNLHLLMPNRGHKDISITCDQQLVAVAFGNLLENAIKYSHKNQGISISLSWNQDPAFVEIAISNYGIPIDASEVEAIFQVGYRTEQAMRRDLSGSGLGLHLARLIARSHGGDVLYRPCSDESHTVFVLILPREVRG
jgi:signal transduction histidine kinase